MATIDSVFVELGTKLRRYKEEMGMELLRRIKARTPVDTGALQRSWGFTRKATSFEVYNTKDYASFVEYGTIYMTPRLMLRQALDEIDQVSDVAAKKAKLDENVKLTVTVRGY